MERIFRDIERSIESRLYYPALLVTLTIPEICAGLTLEREKFVKREHYVAFVDKYAPNHVLGVNGESCFHLRGGLVHRADLRGHAYFEDTHVIFTVPETQFTMHSIKLEVDDKRALVIDLNVFCDRMIKAARKWREDHANDPLVEENMKNLIRWCPEGLAPFIGGRPIVASGA